MPDHKEWQSDPPLSQNDGGMNRLQIINFYILQVRILHLNVNVENGQLRLESTFVFVCVCVCVCVCVYENERPNLPVT